MDDFAQFSADVLDESNLPAPREILGDDGTLTPWDAFMSEPARIGANVEIGDDEFADPDITLASPPSHDNKYEISHDVPAGNFDIESAGYDSRYEIGDDSEIGDDALGANTEIGAAIAVRAVLTKARDNRSPAPPMRAVEVNAPVRDAEEDWLLADTCIGAALVPRAPSPVVAGPSGSFCRCPSCGIRIRLRAMQDRIAPTAVGEDAAAAEAEAVAAAAAAMAVAQAEQEAGSCRCPNCGAMLRLVLAAAPTPVPSLPRLPGPVNQPAVPKTAVPVSARGASRASRMGDYDLIGVVVADTVAPYPLLTKHMQRCGAGMPPRVVRVDTEESYKALRASDSPEMAAFHQKFNELERKFAAHARNPYAHENLAEDVADLTWLGAKADEVVAEKRIEMDLLPGTKGKHDAWTDDEAIFASIKIPHEDGGVWWLTSAEPWDKSVKEASRHAAESNASASVVGEMIPAIGERLGAATAIKEMVAAVPAILARPEAKGFTPFVVRVEPAMNPALCALVFLALDCANGNAQACDEWNRLGASAPAQIKQAMTEAVATLKKKKV